MMYSLVWGIRISINIFICNLNLNNNFTLSTQLMTMRKTNYTELGFGQRLRLGRTTAWPGKAAWLDSNLEEICFKKIRNTKLKPNFFQLADSKFNEAYTRKYNKTITKTKKWNKQFPIEKNDELDGKLTAARKIEVVGVVSLINVVSFDHTRQWRWQGTS